MTGQRGVVVGIGNEFRGDDAAGLHVVRRLPNLGGYAIIESSGEATSMLEVFAKYAGVIVVDAIRADGQRPGTITAINALDEGLAHAKNLSSTHNFGLAEAIKLGEVLGHLPVSLQVIGIEGLNFEMGTAMSSPVEQAVETLVDNFTDYL